MKKSIDEKKQKWEEARAKYVLSSTFKIHLLYFQVCCFIFENWSFICTVIFLEILAPIF